MTSAVNQGRRNFLKAGAAAGGGLIVGFYLPGAARPAEANTGVTKLSSFLKIGTDGKVTFFCGQAEMGQGAHNALAMLIAEELEVDFKDVSIEQGSVDGAFGNPRYIGFKAVGGAQATGGSSSVRNVGVTVRRAGASARYMLIAAAAERMKVNISECVGENGLVIHQPSGKKLSYGAIASEAAKMVPLVDPVLKQPGQFKLIGKTTKRHDIPLKVNGKAIYGIDVKRPGMFTAVVARSPVLGGKVKSFSGDAAMRVKGVKKVVEISSGVAVVADSFWAAKKGRDALQASWDEGPMAQVSSPGMYKSWAELAKGSSAAERLKVGDVDKALGSAAKRVESVYEVPFLAHASMEPMNATAHFKGDSVEIWAPTQAQ